ncbi:MAG: hypothetical protein AAF658_06390, partial [Myxococcota bacterium]
MDLATRYGATGTQNAPVLAYYEPDAALPVLRTSREIAVGELAGTRAGQQLRAATAVSAERTYSVIDQRIHRVQDMGTRSGVEALVDTLDDPETPQTDEVRDARERWVRRGGAELTGTPGSERMAQLEIYLSRALGRDVEAVFTPDEIKRIATDASEITTTVGGVAYSDREVGFITNARARTIAEEIERLPPEQRDEVRATLSAIATSAAMDNDPTRANIALQIL